MTFLPKIIATKIIIATRHTSWAANLHIQMVSVGSCGNRAWYHGFSITGMNYNFYFFFLESVTL